MLTASSGGFANLAPDSKTQSTATNCQQSQDALNETAALLAKAEEMAHLGSWQIDLLNRKILWSKELFNIFGLQPRPYGLSLEEYQKFIHPTDADLLNKVMTRLISFGKLNDTVRIDYRIVLGDGSVRVLTSERAIREVTRDGKPKVIVGIEQDITERKKAEEALAESEERFRSLVESTSDWIWQVDENGVYTYASPKIRELLGYDPQDVIGKTPFDLMPKGEREKIEKIFKELAEKKISFQNLENWNLHKNGNLVLFETSGVPILDEKRKLIGYRGIDRDITQRNKNEQALLESEERFRLVAEAAKMMVYETDVSTGKVIAFRGSKELVGYRPDEINFTVDWVLSHIHPDDAPNVLNQFKAAAKEGKQSGYVIKYRFLHKNGKYITVQDTAKAIQDSTGKTIRLIGGVIDISQQEHDKERIEQYSKHLEELVEERTKQLKNSERMAAIGQVAGMVGHDIRSPLQAAVSELYFARQAVAEASQSDCRQAVLESLSIIQEQMEYIGKIVSDLQNYAKPLQPNLVEVDLCQFIPEALKTLPVPENIQASAVCEEGIPRLKLDSTFMRRILTNLATNAIQAMPNGGELAIRASKKGSQVIISVEDTGLGIPEEIKPKLFMPLFTTKDKGQGFGLVVVKRMTEAQGGMISFESQQGKGTKFIVSLPVQQS